MFDLSTYNATFSVCWCYREVLVRSFRHGRVHLRTVLVLACSLIDLFIFAQKLAPPQTNANTRSIHEEYTDVYPIDEGLLNIITFIVLFPGPFRPTTAPYNVGNEKIFSA